MELSSHYQPQASGLLVGHLGLLKSKFNDIKHGRVETSAKRWGELLQALVPLSDV